MNEQQILLEAIGQSCDAGQERDTLLEKALIFNTDNSVRLCSPQAVELTKREGEVLQLIVSGRTNKQIAKQLSRSERTVEFHRNRLMRKMSAHNAAELVIGIIWIISLNSKQPDKSRSFRNTPSTSN
jgi:two-component system secretion response regulator SsrB